MLQSCAKMIASTSKQ